MSSDSYLTGGGIRVHRAVEPIPMANAIEPIVDALDARRGVLLASSYEYPGRYTRWDMGFVDPPLALVARGRRLRVEALNARGRVLLAADRRRRSQALARGRASSTRADDVRGGDRARARGGASPEEERSRQPSVFSVLRALDRPLPPRRRSRTSGSTAPSATTSRSSSSRSAAASPRPADQRDLVLYLPDELIDRRPPPRARPAAPLRLRGRAARATAGLPARRRRRARTRAARGRRARATTRPASTRRSSAWRARRFKRGDLFEVVPGQTFFEPCPLAAVGALPPPARAQPRALRLPDEPRRGGVPGRRLARDVRARRRRPRRDLPDLGHDRARPRRHRATRPRSRRCSTRPRTSRS